MDMNRSPVSTLKEDKKSNSSKGGYHAPVGNTAEYVGTRPKTRSMHIADERRKITGKGSERKRAVRDKHGNRTTWTFPSGKILILDLVDIQQCVEPGLLVVMTGKKSGTSGKFTKKDKTESKQIMIEAAVPHYHEGKTDNKKKLHAFVCKLLSKAIEDGHSSMGLSLETAGNWHFLKFLEVVMGPVLRYLQELSKEPGVKAITLCAHSLDKLKKTERLIRMSIDPDFVENEIQVEVVSGELNLFEADILVITTSPKLDLSYGRVSSAMLKSAGPELQKECSNNCAEKEVQRSAVIVTGGYNLPCHYVFHGALSTYRPEDPTTNLCELRAFLQNCLSKASEFGATSIALPVIGSENQGFPTDLVASEMFISVEKLRQTERETDRQTSLRFVYFVVYKHDKDNYKIFMRAQRDMVKYPVKHNAHSGNTPKHIEDDRRATQTMKVTAIGKSKNAELAVKALQDKVQTEGPREKREDLTDAEIPPHVKDISENQYRALLKFFPGPFEDIRDSGVELRHTVDKLIVFGKVDDVKEAINKIKELDKSLKEMFQINIGVADSAPSDVQSTVRKITRDFQDVYVLYDKIMAMVHLYGEPEQVTEAGRLLGYYDPRLSGNKEKTKRVEREENMGASHRGASMIKPTFERSFSWTTNAKNVKVYQVERMVVKVYEGNLLVAPSDCIVNDANKDLMHIAGVAGAIADKAGAELKIQSSQIAQSGSLKVGSVVETTAGRLDYKYVLHTVGPNWFDYQPITADSLQQCEKDLYTAILNTFKKAEELKLTSVALPAISSAIFRVPREICASQYTKAVCDFAKTTPTYLQEIYFVDQNNQMVNIIQEAFTTVITDGRPYKVNVKVTSGVDANASKSTVNHDLDQNDKLQMDEELPELSVSCLICKNRLDNPKQLKCGHEFCGVCIDQYFKIKKVCPTCFSVICVMTGDQPDGEMEIQRLGTSVAGYEGLESFGVSYTFASGHQPSEQAHPGFWYKGISRTAYIPNTEEGRMICVMLKVAFERRLVFTIDTTQAPGQDGVITWNDIHHKTDHRPNTQFGYPDPTYLQRVKEELAAKGVFEEDMDQKLLKELERRRYFCKVFFVKKY